MPQHFSWTLICWCTELLSRRTLQSASFKANVFTGEAWKYLLQKNPSWLIAILLYRTLSESCYRIFTPLTVWTGCMKCSGSWHCILGYFMEVCWEIFWPWSFSGNMLFRGSRIDYAWLTIVAFILGQMDRFYIILHHCAALFFLYWSIRETSEIINT